MKFFLTLLLLFFFYIGLSQTNETKIKKGAVLWEEPGSRGAIQCRTKAGDKVEILEFTGDGFWKIKYQDCIGYVRNKYIIHTTEMDNIVSEYEAKIKDIQFKQDSLLNIKAESIMLNIVHYANESKLKIVFKDGARIVSERDIFGKTLKRLTKNDTVTVLNYKNDYFQVKHEGVLGYISKVYMPGPNDKPTYFYELAKTFIMEKEKANHEEEKAIHEEEKALNLAENKRIDSLAKIDLNKLKAKKMIVYKTDVASINSAGGVNLYIRWRYLNSKTIKYIYFTVTPYNAVGDIVYSEIGRKSTANLQITGPINASVQYRKPYWENVWYNNTVHCIKLNKVRVEYMDGSSYTYVNELNEILGPDFKNNCSYSPN